MGNVNVGTKGHIDHETQGTDEILDDLTEGVFYIKAVERIPDIPIFEQRKKKGKKGKMLKDWE